MALRISQSHSKEKEIQNDQSEDQKGLYHNMLNNNIKNQQRFIPWNLHGDKKVPATHWQNPANRKKFEDIQGNVGIVFDKFIDTLVGLDIDDCISDDGSYNAVAQRAIELFQNKAYIEVSISGNGLHFIFFADLGVKGFNTGDFEYYEDNRYFTISGNVIPESTPDPQICQNEIKQLIQEFAPHKLLSAEKQTGPNDISLTPIPKIQHALNHINPDCNRGDWLNVACALHHEFEGSNQGFDLFHEWSSKAKHSYQGELDCLSIWNSLGKYEGSKITIGTLFKMAKDNNVDFTPMEQAEMLPQTGNKSLLGNKVVLGETLKPVDWVIDYIIPEGVGVIAGSPGVGKTTAIIPLALAAAGFIHYTDNITAKITRNVVVFTEDSNQVERIIYGAVKHMERVGNKPVTLTEVAERVHVYGSKRVNPATMRGKIAEAVKLYSLPHEKLGTIAPLLIFDTASANIDLTDENSNSQVSASMAVLKEFYEERKVPSWVITHLTKTAKNQQIDALTNFAARGGGAWEGDAQWTALLGRAPIPGSENEFTNISVLQIDKERVGDLKGKELNFTLTLHEEWVIDRLGEEATQKYPVVTIELKRTTERKVEARQVKASKLEQAIIESIKATAYPSRRDIFENIGGNKKFFDDTWKDMAERRIIGENPLPDDMIGKRGKHPYYWFLMNPL